MSSDDYKRLFKQDHQEIDRTQSEAMRGWNETGRVEDIIRNTSQILNDLDAEFCRRTQLNPHWRWKPRQAKNPIWSP